MTTRTYPAMDAQNQRYLRFTRLLNGSSAIFSVALAVWILIDPARRADPDWVFWLVLTIAMLHTVEEYIIPGGFIPWFNQAVCHSSDPFLPLNAHRAFLTDGTAAILTLPILLLISAGILPVWIVFFLAMALYLNAFLHIMEWIISARYSPGGITAVLLIVPGYSWIIYFYLAEGLITPIHVAAAFLAGVFLNIMFFSFLRRWIRMSPSAFSGQA